MSYANFAVEAPAIQIGRGINRSVAKSRALAGRIYAAWQAGRNRCGDPTRLYRLDDHVLSDIGLTRTEIGAGQMDSLWRD
jgi:uncharacterized protein YjiS (DUF1127 family)